MFVGAAASPEFGESAPQARSRGARTVNGCPNAPSRIVAPSESWIANSLPQPLSPLFRVGRPIARPAFERRALGLRAPARLGGKVGSGNWRLFDASPDNQGNRRIKTPSLSVRQKSAADCGEWRSGRRLRLIVRRRPRLESGQTGARPRLDRREGTASDTGESGGRRSFSASARRDESFSRKTRWKVVRAGRQPARQFRFGWGSSAANSTGRSTDAESALPFRTAAASVESAGSGSVPSNSGASFIKNK